MKLDSKYFDSIRLSRKREKEEPSVAREAEPPPCQWKGCNAAGSHRAPMGRRRDGEYYLFCIDHVRQYNASYNYFDGMSDADVERFIKDAVTGHRPTWRMGDNMSQAAQKGAEPGAGTASADPAISRARDPHGFFAWRAKQAREQPPEQRRQLKPLERKAYQTLHLSAGATREEIKARFKALVKEHHPDANGGDRRSEEKLREIIQAYNHLKQAGLV